VAPTGASVILAGPTDRAILTAPGSIPLLRASDVPASLVARARHVHAGSVFLLDSLRPDLAALLAGARARGLTTSVDCNWDPREEWDGGLRAILAQADVFLPNAGEAARLTGLDDVEEAARALVGQGPRVVAVKLGARGALAATPDGRVLRAPALAVEPVDTTGAGDSFDAGFLAAWLAGRPLEACLALGVACGSLSTRGVGGTATQPTLAEAEAAARAAGLPA
jgi:sugar/nucleoside kinase (ribokinase family)